MPWGRHTSGPRASSAPCSAVCARVSHHAPGDRLAQINWGTPPAAGYDTGEPVIEGPDWRSPIVRATSPRRHGYRPAPGLVLFPFSPEFVALAANLFGDVVDHIEVRGRAAHH